MREGEGVSEGGREWEREGGREGGREREREKEKETDREIQRESKRERERERLICSLKTRQWTTCTNAQSAKSALRYEDNSSLLAGLKAAYTSSLRPHTLVA